MRFAALLLCLPLLGQNVSAQDVRVEGRVVDTDGNPIAGAQVIVNNKNRTQVLSRDDGSFLIQAPPLADYIFISAEKSGYPKAQFGSLEPRWLVKPGEVLSGVVIRLAQAATLTGSVTDESGVPVERATVTLFKSSYSRNGQPSLGAVASTSTNSQGTYRLSGLAPGRYYVVAGKPTAVSARARRSLTATLPTLPKGLPAFFGGGSSIAQATRLVLAPGQLETANITLLDAPLFTIRGKLVDPSGNSMAGLIVKATGENNLLGSDVFVTASGEFEISGLPAGRYQLSASLPARASDFTRIRGTTIAVADGSESSVTFQVGPGITVQGRVRMEEGELPIPSSPSSSLIVPNGDSVEVFQQDLQQAIYLPSIGLASGKQQNPMAGVVSKDGTFQIVSAEDQPYHVAAGGFPDGVYVKQVKQQGVEVPYASIQPNRGPIEVLLSSKGASVATTLPAPGMTLALWPVTPDQGSTLNGVRAVLSGVQGIARLASLPPGEYRIAALDADSAALRNYAFLSKFASEATRITLAEGDRKNLELPIIPRARFNEEFAKLP